MSRPHALITGGSSGIGQATAIRFAGQGFNVTIVARDPIKLAAAKTAIEQSHPQVQVLSLTADVAQRSEIEAAVQQSIEQFGAPTVLVTCAGIAHPGYFRALPIEVFEQTMAVNYFGSLYCIRAALPAMEAQRQGHIVLVSSGAGLIGIYGYTPYSPSKFALRGLAEALRGELKVWGIGVSVIYPPDTDTPQLAAENLTKPPETKQITATAQTWTADAVAQQIVQGVARKAFVIAPGSEMVVLARLHSLIAPILNWYFDRLVQQTRRSQSADRNL
ncbi:MAG: SDR family oxidoreductase [Elainella sp. Prado103]|jgi:3-dehydrosphinganine reductase|nr:SDR family oxidoreductase [Elainella sp. Prado103]